ncbi:Hsp20/alpha crystallin family protein [Methanobacterium sp. ACI-7]|uniref:Hsp20/alpha crystallin family protein n=1 Tax=unclassified Methanobacterium TaxID=2627676 RepID=UPI0039C4BA32
MAYEENQKIPVSPAAFIYHTEEEYIMEIELPGVNKEDIDVKITENTFCVRAPRRNMEYTGCWFLAHEFNADESNASYKNGLLTVKVPIIESKKGKNVRVD